MLDCSIIYGMSIKSRMDCHLDLESRQKLGDKFHQLIKDNL